MEIWLRYAAEIRADKALPRGHHLVSEAPNETYAALHQFFSVGSARRIG